MNLCLHFASNAVCQHRRHLKQTGSYASVNSIKESFHQVGEQLSISEYKQLVVDAKDYQQANEIGKSKSNLYKSETSGFTFQKQNRRTNNTVPPTSKERQA